MIPWTMSSTSDGMITRRSKSGGQLTIEVTQWWFHEQAIEFRRKLDGDHCL